MTPPAPELVEKVAEIISEHEPHWDNEGCAKAVIPIIESALLREMMRPSARCLLAACPTLTDGEAVLAARTWTEILKAFARERGLLEGE